MNQEHGPKDTKTYNRRANYDIDREFLGALESGEYLDAHNMRPSSTDGNKEASDKFRGEELLSDANANGTYECIGLIDVKGQRLAFWAEVDGAFDPVIRVDGVIVAQNQDLPILKGYPLQLDKNESCVGGEVFITDNRTPPMILNVKDMVDSVTADPDKYFSAFNKALYQVNLQRALDIPVFIDLVNVGGGGGLPVGMYRYEMRYVSEDGDRTNWSQSTPPIPVPQNLSERSAQYPYVKTYGDEPNPESSTRYGIRLRFRVTNEFNYDFIEIKRVAFNEGAGIGFTPQQTVIAKIDIDEGEISVREFIDPAESNTLEVIPDDEDTRQIAFVESAKAIRYFDKRTNLSNVKLASKEVNVDFEELNGKTIFSIKENIGKAGHNDPYHHTYKKHYTGGERVGIGIQFYDGVGGRGFVQKHPDAINYQVPNRRDPIDADGERYSYGGTVKAAATDRQVRQTHEVFDLEESIEKEDLCSFKNIYNGDNATHGFKTRPQINTDCPETEDGEIENKGANANLVGVFPYYHPYTPVSQNDNDHRGHNYRTNLQVDTGSGIEQYNPKGFAPRYFSTGIAIPGISNIPEWVKAFSVQRTDIAERVVASGIGMYSMDPAIFRTVGNKKLTTKDPDKLWFFSPDIENGVVNGDIINDIIDSPENYKIQFVSPLGFFSEVYSFEENTISDDRDRLVDMVTYARMIRDLAGGEINPAEDPNMGIPSLPFDGHRYVDYSRYRNTGSQSTIFDTGDQGNNTAQLVSADRISEGRGGYMSLEFDKNLYVSGGTGGTGNNDFSDQGMKDFTEPFYIINIIQEGAAVRDQNIQAYKNTGHYQKVESIIGEGDGDAGTKYILVDKRWEDCIPALESSHPNAGQERYLYIRNQDNSEEKWVNVTFKSAGQIAAINNDIVNNGFYGPNVTGMYRHKATTQDSVDASGLTFKDRFFDIVFDQGYVPQPGQKIIVKYDNTAPMRVFGGDSIIGESIFSPIDRESNAKDDAQETQFEFGIGFPYRKYRVNPRQYIIKRTTGVSRIQDKTFGTLGFIRQMAVMFCCESRVSIHLSHSLDYPLQHFPSVHYVMRPNRWDEDKTIEENNIFPEYVDDYGEEEKTRWKFGGIRFIQPINIDYSAQSPKESFSKPEFGFEEETEFCVRHMWSLPRATNQQDSPGLRTFPANNSFDISDDRGEIKRLYDDISGKGENIYAITESGICLLLHKKSVLSETTSTELGLLSADRFIGGEYWIDRNHGMPDELWRGSFEGPIIIPTDEGGVRRDALFFTDGITFLRLADNNVEDLAKGSYYSRINPVLNKIRPGFLDKITGVYYRDKDEAWLHISRTPTVFDTTFDLPAYEPQNDGDVVKYIGPNATTHVPPAATDVREYFVCNETDVIITIMTASPFLLSPGSCVKVSTDGNMPLVWTAETDEPLDAITFIYGQEKGGFYGTSGFKFDRFVSIGDRIFGLRELQDYELDKGYIMNGEPVEGYIIQASAQNQRIEKEFIRIQANSLQKPTRIEVLDRDFNVMCALDEGLRWLGKLYPKEGRIIRC